MNGLAADITALAAAVLIVSIGALLVGFMARHRDCHRPQPVRVADLPRRLKPAGRRIWDGHPFTDPHTGLLIDDELEASISRHPAGKDRR